MGLESLEFVLTIERELGLQLADEDIEVTATVGQLTDLVWREISLGRSKNDPILLPKSRSEVFDYLVEVLVVDLGVTGKKIGEETNFAKDLRLD